MDTRTVVVIFVMACVLAGGVGVMYSELRNEPIPVSATRQVPKQSAPTPGDLAQRLRESYLRAADLLVRGQDSDGFWKQGPPGRQAPSVAFTCMAVYALAGAPSDLRGAYQTKVDRAMNWLAKQQKDNGAFSETMDTLKTYCTSLALMAFAVVDAKKYAEPIKRCQEWLSGSQVKEGQFKGGLGYGDLEIKIKKGQATVKKEEAANLSTTGFGAQAMEESGSANDEFWRRAAEFVEKCQNNSEGQKNIDPGYIALLKEKGFTLGNDGGAFYAPVPDAEENKAGAEDAPDGSKILRSYGNMTYEALKTYLYAGLTKEDPRVQAAVKWIRGHYGLDEHPGFEFDPQPRERKKGLFYYYMVFAKGLDAYGERPFKTTDGKEHDWPVELAEQLMKTQKDGLWVNENIRWWEGDPVLCTLYCLQAYNVIFKYVT